VLLWLAIPVVAELGLPRVRVFAPVCFSLLLIWTIYAVSPRKRDRLWAVRLAVPALATFWGSLLSSRTLMAVTWPILTASLLLFTMTTLLTHVLTDATAVTPEKIYGSVYGYLLLSFAWAFMYELLYTVRPAAFRAPGTPGASLAGSFVYDSFSTITSVGFGDIVPVSELARTLSTAEAVTGQFSIAVLIARLVALHIAHASTQD
jgi:voltage-gated potassium channel